MTNSKPKTFIKLISKTLNPPELFPQFNIPILYKLAFFIFICFIIKFLIIFSFQILLFSMSALNIDSFFIDMIFYATIHILAGFVISLFIKSAEDVIKICCYYFLIEKLILELLFSYIKTSLTLFGEINAFYTLLSPAIILSLFGLIAFLFTKNKKNFLKIFYYYLLIICMISLIFYVYTIIGPNIFPENLWHLSSFGKSFIILAICENFFLFISYFIVCALYFSFGCYMKILLFNKKYINKTILSKREKRFLFYFFVFMLLIYYFSLESFISWCMISQKELGSENTYIYSYDMDGNIIGMSDDDSKLFYEYDELDRVLSVSTKGSSKQPAITQRYTYDNNSNRTRLRAGFSSDDTGEYDEENDIDISYTYDLENQLTDIGSLAGNFHFEYDDLSRMLEMTYPNGIKTEMSYEGDIRLSKIEHIKEGTFFDRVQSLFKYTYDNFNNRTSMKTFRRTLPINSHIDYSYDKKDQLLTATNPLANQTNETFTYDITGNRLRKAGQAIDSVYNDNNQLTDDQTYTYTYDDEGNLIQKTHKTTKATTKYAWDIENRLIQVTKHESEDALPSETITYAYDALGRRIEKNINGNIKRYVYDNKDILMEFNGENFFQKFYLHGLGIDDPLAMIEDNTDTREDTEDLKVHYYHKDGLGSVTSLTDESGNEKEKYVYSAFGKATIFDEDDKKREVSALGNPYFFTGRESDVETGLQYHRARYYDLDLGRWISEDPIEFDSGDENLYRYTYNNPLFWIDPDGEGSILGPFVTICRTLLSPKITKTVIIRKKFEKCLETKIEKGDDFTRFERCDRQQRKELADLNKK